MTQFVAEIATNRFGLGARAGEIARSSAAPQRWLLDQLRPLGFDAAIGSSDTAQRLFARHQQQMNRNRKSSEKQTAAAGKAPDKALPDTPAHADIGRMANALALDMLGTAIGSDAPFAMHLLDFFSNHFSVSDSNLRMRALAPTLEREAIAPHIAGKFANLLLAVEQHPAMLVYLNNEQSFGPDSAIGKRRERGLNENLAREILELHTLGVDGGYTQDDVRELAMGITGWSVGAIARNEAPGFRFREQAHQPGTRTLLGKRHAVTGQKQGKAMLLDLALHPSTAHHLSFKLARHFVTDQPPLDLVQAMSRRWLATGGELREVLATMLGHPASWALPPAKLKTPREFVISAARAAGTPGRRTRGLIAVLGTLGQQPFGAGSPAGFGDITSAWDGSEALMLRIDWADELASRIRDEPLDVARNALGSLLSTDTAGLMKGAESRQQALAILLMSPEFQRR
ncbi:MAG: DUF1800 domain-containing protein [Gammaproteobacteria bacterium]|nr:DUF1800 domain-containing protein [Gammaproteobacteria bacterium]